MHCTPPIEKLARRCRNFSIERISRAIDTQVTRFGPRATAGADFIASVWTAVQFAAISLDAAAQVIKRRVQRASAIERPPGVAVARQKSFQNRCASSMVDDSFPGGKQFVVLRRRHCAIAEARRTLQPRRCGGARGAAVGRIRPTPAAVTQDVSRFSQATAMGRNGRRVARCGASTGQGASILSARRCGRVLRTRSPTNTVAITRFSASPRRPA